jgi:hypothetical protein
MAGGGYTVDPNALNETAQGINATISDLGKLGFSETAGTGMGFTGLTLSVLQLGHPGLTSAFRGFTGRWQWGVRSLVQDGNQIAQRLGLSAGAYYQADQKVIGSLKDLVDAAAGDPHMTDAQAAAASWSQDAAEVTGAKTPEGNMTWQQAQQQIAAQWKAEGKDVLQNGWKSPLVNPAGPAISAAQSVAGGHAP